MGLTFDKILVILIIGLILVGPERLPVYAKKLGELVRSLRRMADGAKDRMRDEMGPEFDEVDWKKLDPRQYDPRRIIRDALIEDEADAARSAAGGAAATTGRSPSSTLPSDGASAVHRSAASSTATGFALRWDEEAT